MTPAEAYEQNRAQVFRDLRRRHYERGAAIQWRIGLRRALVVTLLPAELVAQVAVGLWSAMGNVAFAARHGWVEAPEHLLEADARNLRAKFPTPMPSRTDTTTPTEARGG